MAAAKGRTQAMVWDPGVLPPPIRVGRGRKAVVVAVQAVGRDLLVTITGGQGHAGAVAVAGPGRRSGTCPGLIVVPPHKEGPLAEACALLVAEAAGCTCVAVAGIHQDQATQPEIAAIVTNAQAGVQRLAACLSRVPPDQRYCRARLPKPSSP